MLTRRIVVNLAAWYESAVIVQIAYHPLIVIGHLEIRLPQVVTVRSLESTLTPDLPRSLDRFVQSSLDEGSVDGVVADRCDLLAIVLEVAFDLAGAPVPLPAQLEDRLNCLLRRLPVGVRDLGFDA